MTVISTFEGCNIFVSTCTVYYFVTLRLSPGITQCPARLDLH